MPGSEAGAGPTTFSVVSACYNVASYLPDFIDSLDAQNYPPELVEIIMVDDGSTDGETARLLSEWAARRPDVVRVITQENGGQGSARNAGLSAARNTWVTFPDPDDILEPAYLRQVATLIEANPSVDMVATNRLLLNDTTKELTPHPLRRHFGSDQVKNLARDERFFHGSAPATFFRTERVAALGLRYDDRIRPNFEDGHFCSSYLLDLKAPLVGFVESARYLYRKRQDNSSTLQTAMSHPGRYTAVLRYGYLDLLERATTHHDHVPLWLQNFLLYELNYYLSKEDSAASGIVPDEVADEFHDLMGRITSRLEPEAVQSYNGSMSMVTRDIIQHGFADEPWVSPRAAVSAYDEARGLIRVTYRFTGPTPTEVIEFGDQVLVPTAAKVRDIRVQGRVLLRERLLWVPVRRLRLRVNGRLMLLDEEPAQRQEVTVRPARIAESFGHDPAPTPSTPLTLTQRALQRRARSRRVRAKYRDAWVLMDRVHNSDDSGEHLFQWLRRHRPGVNAWFVVEEGTPDWKRLHAEHPDRVVGYGTKEWILLMLNAQHVISSHADMPMANPPALRAFQPHSWQFSFLQHGVIKDDLSGWLNARKLDLFVTSTEDEYQSIVADHTTYKFTARETVLTGLPRFDLLYRAAASFPPEKRDLILVSPTWREWLVPPLKAGSQRRESVDDVATSEYMDQWLAFLASDELKEAAASQNLRIAVLPHPNMEANLDLVELPQHVERLSYDGTDVRELFARAAVLVTDYSSTAFNAAYIRRPVVYFQFDAERVLGGGHVGRGGYFKYETHGFGPVAATVDAAVRATIEVIDAGREPSGVWAERIDSTFPFHDDKSCERVFLAIKALGRKVRPQVVDGTEAPEPSDAEEAPEPTDPREHDVDRPEPSAPDAVLPEDENPESPEAEDTTEFR